MEGVSRPDPFLIDQARAVLVHLSAQSVALVCQNRYVLYLPHLLDRRDLVLIMGWSGY